MTKTFTIKESLKFGWGKTFENLSFLLITTLCFMIVGAIFGSLANNNSFGFVFRFINTFVNCFGSFTAVRIGLKIYKGEKPNFKDIFNINWNTFGLYILASILYMVITGVGFILLIVPGIILAVRLGFFRFILIDEGAKVIDSIKKSFELTRGFFWQLLLLSLVFCIINILGAIIIGIGLLFTIPLTILAVVFVYEKLKLAPRQVKTI